MNLKALQQGIQPRSHHHREREGSGHLFVGGGLLWFCWGLSAAERYLEQPQEAVPVLEDVADLETALLVGVEP